MLPFDRVVLSGAFDASPLLKQPAANYLGKPLHDMVQVELVDGSSIWSRYARSSVPPELEGIAFPRYGEPIEGLAYSVFTVTEQTFPDSATATTPILLAADGCVYDDGPRNCFRVCNDPAALFSSWYNLWNCFTLAAMAAYVQNASLAMTSIAGLQVANSHLGFGSLETFNASSIIDSVIICGERAAYDGSLGYLADAKGVSTTGAPTPLENLTFFWTLPCFHVQSDLNNDIAGAGVMIVVLESLPMSGLSSDCSFRCWSHISSRAFLLLMDGSFAPSSPASHWSWGA